MGFITNLSADNVLSIVFVVVGLLFVHELFAFTIEERQERLEKKVDQLTKLTKSQETSRGVDDGGGE